MTAFAPPDFVFNGINFNPNFYDNPPLTPSGSIPSPLPVTQLNTNNIQALNNAAPVNLYTTFTNILNLGNSLVSNIIIESGSSLSILGTTIMTIGSSALANLYINAYSINLYSVETYFNNVLNTCKISIFPNDTYPSIQFNSSTSGGFQDASIEVNPKATIPTTNYEGTINIRATTLNTPQTITAITPSSQVNLFTNSTSSINIGNSITPIVNINANDTNILAANSLYMNSTTTTSILASTINLISNEIIVGGGQDIQQQNTSNQFTIGGNIITRNFYLGNLVAPPQVPFTATAGFDVVNYDTCLALIASGGGVPTL
jgi:hypothetical protein